jgi:hypothetical protein
VNVDQASDDQCRPTEIIDGAPDNIDRPTENVDGAAVILVAAPVIVCGAAVIIDGGADTSGTGPDALSGKSEIIGITAVDCGGDADEV